MPITNGTHQIHGFSSNMGDHHHSLCGLTAHDIACLADLTAHALPLGSVSLRWLLVEGIKAEFLNNFPLIAELEVDGHASSYRVGRVARKEGTILTAMTCDASGTWAILPIKENLILWAIVAIKEDAGISEADLFPCGCPACEAMEGMVH